MATGWTKETSLGRKERIFSQGSRMFLPLLQTPFGKAQRPDLPCMPPTAPVLAGEDVPPQSSTRAQHYSSQEKQWTPSDSSLLKLDWPKYFQIFSRTQSCSSQALMSVISVICFSIQLQLKTAKFFLSHYRTKWSLNYVTEFFFKKQEETETRIC